MKFKENINKIHYLLSNNFEDISILEKTNLKYGNYIELSINEGNKKFISIIRKVDLENNKFNWLYMSNPSSEESYLIERNSSLDNFHNDVKDIFDKNRFDSDYIKNLDQ